jgi:flagellar biosynthesis/type III secretory pathway protein FliH
MARMPVLESFDAPPPAPEPVDTGPSADWFAGHAAGLAEGQATAEARQTALRESVVQSLADIEFRFAEARSHLIGALRPLFATLTDVILPAALQAGFGQQVAQALSTYAERDMGRPMLLSLNPQDTAAVGAAIGGLHLHTLRIVPDPGLAPGQAVLNSGAAETMIDTAAVLAAVRTALAAVTDESLLRSEHG